MSQTELKMQPTIHYDAVKYRFTSKMYCGLHFQLDVTSYLPDLPPLILLISKIADLPGTRFPNDEVVMAELIECLTSQFFF
jgi:hypothetical protein